MKNIAIMILAAVLGAGIYYSLSSRSAHTQMDKKTIICFGDSITEGYFLREEESYPYQLGLLLGEEVINQGISGETSTEALSRVKRDVSEKNPKLVIVQFGGNDAAYQVPPSSTFAAIDSIVAQISEAEATAVLLIGDARMLEPGYIDGFREIAERRQVLLIENVIDPIVKDPGLRIDDVHPNAQGYRIIAQRVAQAIKPLL